MNNEQPSTHYSLFDQTKIVSLQAYDEYSLSVSSKNCLTGETAMKNRFAETTNNGLHTIRVSPTFCRCFGVIRKSCIAGCRVRLAHLRCNLQNMTSLVCHCMECTHTQYAPVCYWLAIHTLVLLVCTIPKIILGSFEKFF